MMSHLKHEVWRRHLRQETVYQGESPPGIPDILRADKRIWLMLADATLEEGIQLRGGKLPLEDKLDDILKHTQVERLLCIRERTKGNKADATPEEPATAPKGPKKKKRKGGAQTETAGNASTTKAKNREDNMKRQIANLKEKIGGGAGGKDKNTSKGGKGKGKGKGKNKGKGKGKRDRWAKRPFIPVPAPLIGLDS